MDPDRYLAEGQRNTRFMGADNVIKYHRTVATYVNTLIRAGFQIANLVEPGPSEQLLYKYPEMRDEAWRPMFLLLSSTKDLKAKRA